MNNNDDCRKLPGAFETLYSSLPLQCKQCSERFKNDTEGKAAMDAHLDKHFRQNRKMRTGTKKPICRGWWNNIESWVTETKRDNSISGRIDFE